jgi:hypothetical protein
VPPSCPHLSSLTLLALAQLRPPLCYPESLKGSLDSCTGPFAGHRLTLLCLNAPPPLPDHTSHPLALGDRPERNPPPVALLLVDVQFQGDFTGLVPVSSSSEIEAPCRPVRSSAFATEPTVGGVATRGHLVHDGFTSPTLDIPQHQVEAPAGCQP